MFLGLFFQACDLCSWKGLGECDIGEALKMVICFILRHERSLILIEVCIYNGQCISS